MPTQRPYRNKNNNLTAPHRVFPCMHQAGSRIAMQPRPPDQKHWRQPVMETFYEVMHRKGVSRRGFLK
jgi:hypothetical protein